MFTLIGLNANPLSIIMFTNESPNTFLPIPIAPLISAFNNFPTELWNNPRFFLLPK